jgi:hypothetical protein
VQLLPLDVQFLQVPPSMPHAESLDFSHVPFWQHPARQLLVLQWPPPSEAPLEEPDEVPLEVPLEEPEEVPLDELDDAPEELDELEVPDAVTHNPF